MLAATRTRASAQDATVGVQGNAIHIRAPGFSFIKGESLDRLKQGRPLRFDLTLAVLSKPGGPIVTQSRQSFNVSYDLWEERFAVARVGPSSDLTAAGNSVSHLTARDAEAWCLEHVPLAVSALGRLGRDTPFWVRLHYQIASPDPATGRGDDPLTLQGLIGILSRRRKAADDQDSLEAGPFRLPD
jgi:hypothetical protein